MITKEDVKVRREILAGIARALVKFGDKRPLDGHFRRYMEAELPGYGITFPGPKKNCFKRLDVYKTNAGGYGSIKVFGASFLNILKDNVAYADRKDFMKETDPMAHDLGDDYDWQEDLKKEVLPKLADIDAEIRALKLKAEEAIQALGQTAGWKDRNYPPYIPYEMKKQFPDLYPQR